MAHFLYGQSRANALYFLQFSASSQFSSHNQEVFYICAVCHFSTDAASLCFLLVNPWCGYRLSVFAPWLWPGVEAKQDPWGDQDNLGGPQEAELSSHPPTPHRNHSAKGNHKHTHWVPASASSKISPSTADIYSPMSTAGMWLPLFRSFWWRIAGPASGAVIRNLGSPAFPAPYLARCLRVSISLLPDATIGL